MPLNENLKTAFFLFTLKAEKWHNFVDVVSSEATPPTFHGLCARVRDKIAQLTLTPSQSGAGSAASDTKAFYARERERNEQYRNERDRAEHLYSADARGQRGDRRNGGRVKCDYCGKPGHVKPDCYKLKRHQAREKAQDDDNEDRDKGRDRAFMMNADDAREPPSALEVGFMLDSGATRHIISDPELAFPLVELKTPISIQTAAGITITAHKMGTVRLAPGFILKDALIVKETPINLVSAMRITAAGGVISITNKKAVATFPDGAALTFLRRGNQFVLTVERDSALLGMDALWHARFGHADPAMITRMKRSGAVMGMDTPPAHDALCKVCATTKAAQAKYADQSTRPPATTLGARWHCDVMGPMPVESLGGARYVSVVVDEYSRWIEALPIVHKNAAGAHVRRLAAVFHTRHQRWPREFHSDNGGEYQNKEMAAFCSEHGITQTFSAPYTPNNNAIVERANRSIMERARAMATHAAIAPAFWAETVMAAVDLLNVTQRARDADTAYAFWHGRTPDVHRFRVFGCDSFVHVPKANRNKLDATAIPAILLRWEESRAAYRCWDPASTSLKFSRNVRFNENSFTVGRAGGASLTHAAPAPAPPTLSPFEWFFVSAIPLPEDKNKPPPAQEPARHIDMANQLHAPLALDEFEEDAPHVAVPADPAAPREEEFHIIPVHARGVSPKAYNEAYYPSGELSDRNIAVGTRNRRHPAQAHLAAIVEPATLADAERSPQWPRWEEAIEDEMKSHLANNTWELVGRPRGRRVIGCKWVFKLKYRPDGSIDRYKARLVAKGFRQQEGIDFNETFAPVLKYKSLRIILTVAALWDLELAGLDVTTAFLYATVKEEIFMEQPEGFSRDSAGRVCRLLKSLYGIKQAPFEWNEEFNSTLLSLGFTRSHADPCVYTKLTKSKRLILLGVFVDDSILAFPREDAEEWSTIRKELVAKYKIKIADEVEFILGMKIERNRQQRTIKIHQGLYTKSILERFGMANSKQAKTPTSLERLTKIKETSVTCPYQEAVGALLYLSISTRPDIAYAVHAVSKHIKAHGDDHWTAVKRIFRYLVGTQSAELLYKPDSLDLIAYCDADWAGDLDNRRSTTGYLIMLGGCPITWCSKSQSTVAQSSGESEFVSLAACVSEVMWIRQLLAELEIVCDTPTPIAVLCDSQVAIAMTANDGNHAKRKHIDIKYHFICDAVRDGVISIQWIKSEDQLADILTKPMADKAFAEIRSKLVSV
jgi:transposase InsO family protein